jgi:hypothetical protein
MQQQRQRQQQQQQQQHHHHHHHQQQANRGILPSETLNALDYLVDRLNASSGYLPDIAKARDGPTTTRPPIRALLVGTNEGVGLSRSLGTAHHHHSSFESSGPTDDDDDVGGGGGERTIPPHPPPP